MNRMSRVFLLMAGTIVAVFVAYATLLALIPTLEGILPWLKFLVVSGALFLLIASMVSVTLVVAMEQHPPKVRYHSRLAFEDADNRRTLSYFGTFLLLCVAFALVMTYADWYWNIEHQGRLSWSMLLCLSLVRVVYHCWHNDVVKVYQIEMEARGWGSTRYNYSNEPVSFSKWRSWVERHESPFGQVYLYPEEDLPRSPFAQ